MDWFLQRLRHNDPALDYRDLCNHADDFKKLLDLKIIKYSDNIDTTPCDLCNEDHLVSPFPNVKGELVAFCSGSRRAVNPDELKIWTINNDALTKNIRSKTPVVDPVLFKQTAFASNVPSVKKYSGTMESIQIKSLGIEIRGNYISKGNKKVKMNPTDKALIYFLYYKFQEGREECFRADVLALEISINGKRKSEEYVKNRITHINIEVKRLLTEGKTSIGNLIKYEKLRGYHFNPKLFPVTKNRK
jgi:hypothetical protein